MSIGFELPHEDWDSHIHGDGLHIGLTRPGFNNQALEEVHSTLANNGYQVADGGLGHTRRGGYGELALNQPLTKDIEQRLRSLGFTGLESLDN